jgi:hypothetical protein
MMLSTFIGWCGGFTFCLGSIMLYSRRFGWRYIAPVATLTFVLGLFALYLIFR